MAKQLKLNIKNTKLAALLSKKKKTDVKKETPVKPDEKIAKKPIVKAKKITSLLDEKEKELLRAKEIKDSPQDDLHTSEPLKLEADIALEETDISQENITQPTTMSDSDDEILQKPEADVFDAIPEQEQKAEITQVNDHDALAAKEHPPKPQEEIKTSLKDTDTSSFLIRRGPVKSNQEKTQESLPSEKKSTEEKKTRMAHLL